MLLLRYFIYLNRQILFSIFVVTNCEQVYIHSHYHYTNLYLLCMIVYYYSNANMINFRF